MPPEMAAPQAIGGDNEVTSQPSSPEFLLPAFESSLRLSSSSTLSQAQEACVSSAEELPVSGQSAGSRLRRFSRSQGIGINKVTRSPSREVSQASTHSLLDASDIRKYKKAGKVTLLRTRLTDFGPDAYILCRATPYSVCALPFEKI